MRHCGTQILETGRLLLRPLSINDAEMMFGNWACDPEVARYLRWQPHRSWAETAEYLNEAAGHYAEPEFYQWGIEEKVSGALIGSISLARGEADPGWPAACERLGIKYYVIGDAVQARRALNATAEGAAVAYEINKA